jgi:hypothetical protein
LITSWKISQGYATRSRVIFSFLSLIISLIKYYFNEAGSNLLRVFLHLCITWKIWCMTKRAENYGFSWHCNFVYIRPNIFWVVLLFACRIFCNTI